MTSVYSDKSNEEDMKMVDYPDEVSDGIAQLNTPIDELSGTEFQ